MDVRVLQVYRRPLDDPLGRAPMVASRPRKGGETAIDTVFVVLVLTRWIHFASLYVLFGSSFFWIHMGRDAWRGTSPLPRTMLRCAAITTVAAPVVAVSGLAWLVASIANMTGDFAGVIDPDTLHAFFFENELRSSRHGPDRAIRSPCRRRDGTDRTSKAVLAVFRVERPSPRQSGMAWTRRRG